MLLRRMVTFTALVAALALVSCASPGGGEESPSSSQSAAPSGEESASPDAAAASAITIERPVDGETVSVPFIASGTANVFEATLMIDAVDESGFTACARLLTATSGSPTGGTWQGMLAFPPEEDPLRVTLRAYSLSPEDGSMENLVEFPLIISPERPKIILTNPRCGDVYEPGGPVILLGSAELPEAAFSVDLRSSSQTIMTMPVAAEECCVESQFSSELILPSDLPPGFYDIAAYSLAATKDSAYEHEFIVQIEVRG